MNKKMIALAIASAMAAPMAAQAEPKLGGFLQAEIVDWDRDDTTTTTDFQALEDNKRGRLWVYGSEDLGGGLKANYRYEWQVDTADGNAPGVTDGHTNARETYVGLSGGFGEFQMGRLKSPYKYVAGVDYDPYTATVLESRGNGGALKEVNGMTASYGQNSFLSNSLAYKKKFGIVKFWLLYQLAEDSGPNSDDDNVALGLNFTVAKGLGIDLAYITEDRASSTLGGTRTKIGVKWKGGAHKVFLKYETQSSDLNNADVDALFVGYHLSMGKNVLSLQYGTQGSDVANEDVDYAMIALAHNFSKTTKGWVGYRTTDSDVVGTNDITVTANDGVNDVDAFSVGLRIKF